MRASWNVMMAKSIPGVFVTGTDTGVGKTYVTALIARALTATGRRVGVYKPAASGCVCDARGCLVSDDAVALWDAAGRPGDLEHVCPQRFLALWPRTWPPEPKAVRSTASCSVRGWTIGERRAKLCSSRGQGG